EVEYVNEHPEMIQDRNKPGKRHADVGEGHEVVEVPSAGGIVCELHSKPRIVNCPKGMGSSEAAPVVDATELSLLFKRKLPEKLQTDLLAKLDKVVASNDYHPDRFNDMVTKIRHMAPRDIQHQLTTEVQLNRDKR